MKESRNLQKPSQHLTRKILSAQEDKREKISRDLQDKIAQLLVGINVRLFTLKEVNAPSTQDLKKEIASTQILVDKSVRSIDRFVRELPS